MKRIQSLQEEPPQKLESKSKGDETMSTASSNEKSSVRYIPLDDSFDDRNHIKKIKRIKTEASQEIIDLSEEEELTQK